MVGRSTGPLRCGRCVIWDVSIIVVDDEEPLRRRLAAHLVREGFRVTAVESAAAAREVLRRERVDLAIVDLGMPGEDGLSLTRFLRERAEIGVIILSGKAGALDRVIGLEVGADDYLAKPFHLRELVARIRSVLRRSGSRPQRILSPAEALADATIARFAGWRLDLATRALTATPCKAVHLTSGEFQLLAALVDHPGQVLSRDQLLQIVAGRGWSPEDRAVDQHIGRLRRKIEKDPENPQLIRSVRGKGYVLAATVDRGS